jgi:hypothetical protein
MMGRLKRDGIHSPPSPNQLVQDSEGNEGNGYPDPDSKKTKINYTKTQQSPQEQSERRNPASNQ